MALLSDLQEVATLTTADCGGISSGLNVRNTCHERGSGKASRMAPFGRVEAVAEVLDRVQHRAQGRKLLPQPRHVHVYGAVVAGIPIAPDVLEQLCARDKAALVLEEIAEHEQLARRQRNGLAGQRHDHSV